MTARSPSPLEAALEQFNRKERFWLLRDAVGIGFDLHREFLLKIEKEINLTIPSNPWWAFDYHLDWLCAVLSASNYNLNGYRQENKSGCITGTQEDCDLIIAFDNTIILLEAKLYGNWSKQQLRSKLGRLKRLPPLKESVKVWFVLVSPEKWERITAQEWLEWSPNWAVGKNKEPHWIKLPKPDGQRLMVSLCDQDGVKGREGHWWGIFSTR